MRLRFVLGLLLLIFSPRFAAAETINFSTASEAGNTAPLWIAKDLGFFEKYGNTVRLIFIPGASVSIAAPKMNNYKNPYPYFFKETENCFLSTAAPCHPPR